MQESNDNMQKSNDDMQKNFNEAVIAGMTKMSAIQSLEQIVSEQGTSTRILFFLVHFLIGNMKKLENKASCDKHNWLVNRNSLELTLALDCCE